MLKTKLRQLLAENKITPYRFAKTVEAHGKRSQSWAYRSVRGEIGLTTEGIDLIIRCLRELTGKPIEVEDVMGYVDEAQKPIDAHEEQAEKQVWNIVLQESVEQDGTLPALPALLNSKPRDATYYPSSRPRHRNWWLTSLLAVFLLGVGSHYLYRSSVDRRELALLAQPVPVPVQIGPEGDTTSLTPKLRVNAVEGATNYEFSVFNLISRQNVLNENSKEPFFIVPTNAVCPGAPYGWSAKVFRGSEWSSFSSRMEFTVSAGEREVQTQQEKPPDTPQALAPNGVVTSLTPTLEVTPVDTATGYGYYFRDLDTDRVYEYEYAATAATFTLPDGLLKNKGRYRWNARSRNCAGFSMGYTDTLVFNVDAD